MYIYSLANIGALSTYVPCKVYMLCTHTKSVYRYIERHEAAFSIYLYNVTSTSRMELRKEGHQAKKKDNITLQTHLKSSNYSATTLLGVEDVVDDAALSRPMLLLAVPASASKGSFGFFGVLKQRLWHDKVRISKYNPQKAYDWEVYSQFRLCGFSLFLQNVPNRS